MFFFFQTDSHRLRMFVSTFKGPKMGAKWVEFQPKKRVFIEADSGQSTLPGAGLVATDQTRFIITYRLGT
jgi:hypothetical protein